MVKNNLRVFEEVENLIVFLMILASTFMLLLAVLIQCFGVRYLFLILFINIILFIIVNTIYYCMLKDV